MSTKSKMYLVGIILLAYCMGIVMKGVTAYVAQHSTEHKQMMSEE